jgi:hypothetical protein
MGELSDAAIDEVAGNGDEIGFQTIHCIDNRIDIVALDGRPDMEVADLRNGKAVQRFGKINDGHFHRTHPCGSACIDEPDQREQRSQNRHCQRGVGVHRRGGPAPVHRPGECRNRQQRHVAQHGQHE